MQHLNERSSCNSCWKVFNQIPVMSLPSLFSKVFVFFVFGISGEMMVGPAKAVFMDEISTGLDSSTAYRIIKCLSQSVHVMESTMVVSLLQPAPETFELFDDLILLSEGQIVYQGPRDLVTDFFESMGFKCPERKAVADFLQEVRENFLTC